MRHDTLRGLFAEPAFRALLRVRLVGQLSDGLLQAGLVGVVLFTPERQPSPGRIALGFAVLLLPFTLAAPLAGVLLDRWSRVAVLAWANLARAGLALVLAVLAATTTSDVALFGTALLALGLNRLILAALGAALPLTLPAPLLVSGNALSPTAGTGATVVGAGVGLALSGASDAAPFVAAGAGYLLAAAATRRFSRPSLGPDLTGDEAPPFRQAWDDVRDGVAHILRTRPARRVLELMTVHRLLFGLLTVWSIVLIRFRLEVTKDDESAALAGLASIAMALGAGLVVAALVTPPLVRVLGGRRSAALARAAAGAASVAAWFGPRLTSLVVAWVVLGASAQILKIVVDTVLQRSVDDDYRGRVFIAYDLVFNVAFVVGATAVVLLPMDTMVGRLIPAVAAVSYLLLAVWLYRPSARSAS
jgi:MFS family permease